MFTPVVEMVVGLGFEPRKAWLADLQSVFVLVLEVGKGGVWGEKGFPPQRITGGVGELPLPYWGRREGERGLGGFVPKYLIYVYFDNTLYVFLCFLLFVVSFSPVSFDECPLNHLH